MRVDRFGLFVLAVGLVAPSAVSAQSPLFSTPAAVGEHAPVLATGGPKSGGGGGLADLGVALGGDGRATVAWLGAGDELGQPVFVAERAAGGGAFSAPVEVASDAKYALVLGRNDAGVRAVAWGLKVSVAPAGGGFGPAESIPIPPRAPAMRSDVIEDSRLVQTSSIAVASDGAVLLAYTDSDARAENYRVVTVLRRPDGTWTEPQILDDYAFAPRVVADAVGGLHVLWQTMPRSASDATAVYVADAGANGHFGAGHLVSNPAWRTDAWSLSSNRRGDLLVTWQAAPAGPAIGETFRPAGHDWQSPQVLYGDIPYGERPSGALNDRGDAAVAWTNGNAFARSRPAGGAWAAMSTTFVRQGSLNPYQLALDTNGVGLLLSAVCRSEGTIDTIAAAVVPLGGALEPVVTVSPGTDPVSQPVVATDTYGNGLVVWLQGRRNAESTVFASGYSATPPNVTGFVAKSQAFTVRVSEPARTKLTVAGRYRHAVQWSRTRPGQNTLTFRGKVRSLLAHHGRYQATVRAYDVGPRPSRARTIKFNR